MNQRSFIVAVAASLALAAPITAAAPWMSYGDYEPNTVLDDASLMWATPPAEGQFRVYFNVYTTMADPVTGGSGVNPNVGAAGTQIEAVGFEEQWAVLGVWNDCNGDGYIGHAESVLREYRAELLVNDDRCTPITCTSTPGPQRCPTALGAWPANWNNVNGWVTELIPIANGEITGGDRRIIYVKDAAIWGDYAKLDEITQDAGTCAINPQPRGTLQSSGGLLNAADCRTGFMVAWNNVFQGQTLLGQPVPGAPDPLGLTFSNEEDARSNELLGQQQTFGDEHSDNAIVHTGDCSNGGENYLVTFPATPPAGEWNDGVRAPDTAYVNPNGNVAGTVNYTMESGFFASEASDDETNNANSPDCNFDNDRGADFYGLVEGDFNSVSATNKKESDWNFVFSTMSRSGAPLGVPFGPLGASGSAGGAPSDAGVEPFNAFCLICQQTEWFGGSIFTKGAPQSVTTRGTVAEGDIEPVVDDAYWLTYYAYVNAATASGQGVLVSTPGGTGTYSPCEEGFEGITEGGWNCDATQWNKLPNGNSLPDPYGTLAIPGKVYNLLDVDCYDGTVGAAGTGVLPAYHGEAPCRAG